VSPVSGRLPALGRILLAALLPEELRDEITGDLTERYAHRSRESGRLHATVWFWGQIVRLRPLALRRALRDARVDQREAGGMGMSTGWWGDLRQAARGLRTRAAFSATIIATVALALGATTSVFSVVNGVLLRPLDFPEPDRLVRAWQTRPEWADHQNSQLRSFAAQFPLSVPTFNDWQAEETGFESMGMYTGTRWVHQSAQGAELVRGSLVTSGVFRALGVEPSIGRYLAPGDDEVGATSVIVLSHAAWRDRFGGDASILGSSMSLDGQPHVVIGVMPEGFSVPGAGGTAWASLPDTEKLEGRDSQSYTVLGRLRDNATLESAQADLFAIQVRLSEAYPDEQSDMRANVKSLLDSMVGDVRATLLFLLAAVGLVLTIACVNIANMLSVSGLVRRRELAVRAAIGASRLQLIRSLLTESALLAGIGGIGGMVLASATLPVLLGVLPAGLPRAAGIGIDLRVLAFGVVVTALTAVLAGVLPALQAAHTEPKHMMDATGRGLAGGRAGQRVRSALVVTQVALAFVLLVGAGLLSTSFSRLWNVDRGFTSEGLISVRAIPNPVDFPEREDQDQFRTELALKLEALPGVRVTRTNQIPLSGSMSTTTYYLDGDGGEQLELNVVISLIDEKYFDVMEIALVEGRSFDGTEEAEGEKIAVVNRALAEIYWPGQSAIGQYVRAEEDGPPTTIVGVTNNVRHQGLHQPAEPKLYVPAVQNHRSADQWLLRVQGDRPAIIELARQAVTEVSPSTPVRGINILEEQITASVAVQRFRTIFVVGLALMATALALLGVYGVIAFAVSQRTRELAVRMAIGARAHDVIASTVASGARLALGGVALGLLIAWRTSRALEEFLFDVDAVDPVTYAIVAVSIGLVSTLASYLPARRAARVDPVSVLNTE